MWSQFLSMGSQKQQVLYMVEGKREFLTARAVHVSFFFFFLIKQFIVC